MQAPFPLRYAEILRYDPARGVVAAADLRTDPARPTDYATPEQLAQALATGVVDAGGAPLLAGYALAQAARAWQGRPSEARRAALIQAGAWLQQARPADMALAQALAGLLAVADAAIMAGADAEAALLAAAAAALARADRAAERCGRVAAGLLDERDTLLVLGYPGPALGWLLHVAAAEGKQPQLLVLATPEPGSAASITLHLAAALGLAATPIDLAALPGPQANLGLLGAAQIALDGSMLAPKGAAALVAHSRRLRSPCYALSYNGPDPDCPDQAALTRSAPPYDLLPPDATSAIVTHRGIYRPGMVARFLGEGDPPLDVIPLRG